MKLPTPTNRINPAGTTVHSHAFHLGLGEATGAIADLGILVPLATALILVNGLDASAVLVCAGLLVLATGVVFRTPFPVQPLKALTAVAVAQKLAPGVIHAAGLEVAAILLVLSIGRLADLIAKLFLKPVIRAVQLGVGALLVVTAFKLVAKPPGVFAGSVAGPWAWILLVAVVGLAIEAGRSRRYWLALAALVLGTLAIVLAHPPVLASPELWVPQVSVPAAANFATAFLLLVVPQIPLTFGNAVVATDALAHEYFGPAAGRVTPSRICLSTALGNLVSGLLGGMPMCHGSSGLTAHVRFGARTAGMNLLLGGVLLATGLFLGPQVPALLGSLPVWILAGFLIYAGARHALLVMDLRGWDLAIAVVSAAVGIWTGNLAVTAGLALVGAHLARGLQRRASSVRFRAS